MKHIIFLSLLFGFSAHASEGQRLLELFQDAFNGNSQTIKCYHPTNDKAPLELTLTYKPNGFNDGNSFTQAIQTPNDWQLGPQNQIGRPLFGGRVPNFRLDNIDGSFQNGISEVFRIDRSIRQILKMGPTRVRRINLLSSFDPSKFHIQTIRSSLSGDTSGRFASSGSTQVYINCEL